MTRGRIALVAAVWGCSGGPDSAPRDQAGGGVDQLAQAILEGAVDEASTSVVFVYNVAHGRLCTGSLIAPNLVLTAQHCLARVSATDGLPAGSIHCPTSTFGPLVAPTSVVVGSTTTTSQLGTVAGAEILVPAGGSRVCENDLALVVLASSLPPPLLVPRLTQAVVAGEVFRAVGYGAVTPAGSGPGTRRSRGGLAVTCVGDCGPLASAAGTDWQGEMAPCGGDSGGPALDAEGRLIGVLSRGNNDCSGPLYASVVAWSDFLARGASHAADRGHYEAPAWAVVARPGGDPAPALTGADEAPDSGCGVAPGEPSARESDWLAPGFGLLALTLGSLRRARAAVRLPAVTR